MWDAKRDAGAVSIIDYLNRHTEESGRLNAEFVKKIECPNRGECEFFVLHSVVEEIVHLHGSALGCGLRAERCVYQIKSERGGESVPRGLDEGCDYTGDIGPNLINETHPPQKGMREY